MLPTKLRLMWTEDRPRALVLASICAMVAMNQFGTSILTAVIPVQLAADGHKAAAAGGISMMFSLFFLAGCLVGPGIAGRLGPNNALVVIAASNAALALLHWLFPGPVTWMLFRGMGGLVTATYFIIVESWIASQTTAATRGSVFGLYMVVIRLAFALGQMSLALVPMHELMNLFLVSLIAYALSPLLRPRTLVDAPAMRRPRLDVVFEVPRLAPAAVVAAFVHGCAFGTVPALLPKWGVEQSIRVDSIASALTAIQLGGLFVQLPISVLSDRIERRTILALVLAAVAGLSLLMRSVQPDFKIAWLTLMFVWGGLASSVYSVASAHANDLAPPERRVDWVSAIMLIWGAGATVGPLVASVLMDAKGVGTLWLYTAAVNLAASIFMVWRKLVRR